MKTISWNWNNGCWGCLQPNANTQAERANLLPLGNFRGGLNRQANYEAIFGAERV